MRQKQVQYELQASQQQLNLLTLFASTGQLDAMDRRRAPVLHADVFVARH